MTNRAAKVVPLIGAVLLASATLVTVQLKAAIAADDCLAKPTGGGAGQHWFYHLDRATKRQCWYLRDKGAASTTSAQAASGSGQAVATARNATQLPPSTANAHAEWPAANAAGDDDSKSASAAQATDSGATMNAANASAPPASPSALAARWPDGTDAPATTGTLPPQQTSGATPAPKAATLVAADATDAPSTAPSAERETDEAAAPVAAVETQGGLSRTFLLAGLAALALAGSLISVVWARLRSRRQIQLETSARRGPRWPEEMPDETMSPPWRQPAAQDLDRYLDQGFDDDLDSYPDHAPLPVRNPHTPSSPVRAETATAAARRPRHELSEIEELLSHYAGQTGNG